jgi:ribulose-5-phosphate 4-epimerase/fuculose-1-phosphate aldolase
MSSTFPAANTLTHICAYLTEMEEITPLLQFMRDKSTKKLHSEKFREKAAAKLAISAAGALSKAPLKHQLLPQHGLTSYGDAVQGAMLLADQLHGGMNGEQK